MKYAPFAAACFLLVISSCGTSVQEQRTEPRRSETVTPNSTPPAAVQPTFRKTLERGPFSADLTATGSGARRALTLTARQSGRELAAIRDSIAGEVTEAVVADLNQNDLPEVLVFVRSARANANGQVYGYEFATQGWERFQLPTLPPEATAGYQGHDQFRVAGADLVRTFPIYRPTDAPTKPTGGQRAVRYALDHTLQLTEISIDDKSQ